jgi:hypothetical protein
MEQGRRRTAKVAREVAMKTFHPASRLRDRNGLLKHAVIADREMDEAALRLSAPIAVGGHLDFGH